MEKRPCAEWYKLDKSCDIMDADGFQRNNNAASAFWFFVPVLKEYYDDRKFRCSITSFNKINHVQPFQLSDVDIKLWEIFANSSLGTLILLSM
jgi:hypothetical protein